MVSQDYIKKTIEYMFHNLDQFCAFETIQVDLW